MSQNTQSLFFRIVDDPKKRKQFVIALVILIIVIIGVVRYASHESVGVGEVMSAENVISGEQESSETAKPEGATSETVQDADPGEIIALPAPAEPLAVFVDVGGAVVRAGVIALPPGSRITDAIEAVGGLADNADISVINRAQIIADGDKIYIPTATEVENGRIKPSVGLVTGTGTGSAVNGSAPGDASAVGNAPGRINLNSADSETLQLLNGVGPAMAQKIIDYRNAHGQYKRIEDLMNVSGIGQKTFEKLKDEICV